MHIFWSRFSFCRYLYLASCASEKTIEARSISITGELVSGCKKEGPNSLGGACPGLREEIKKSFTAKNYR